jgi:hypothetical protein
MKIIQTQTPTPSQIFEKINSSNCVGISKISQNEIFFEASNVRLKLENQKLLCYIRDELHCTYA